MKMSRVAAAAIVACAACSWGQTTQPASPEERQLVQVVEKALNVDHDAAVTAACWDMDALVDRAVGRIKDMNDSAGLKRGLRQGLTHEPILEPIARQMKENHGHCRFLRVVTEGGERRLVFRVNGEPGINYVSLVLKPGPNPKIVDFDSLVTGELMSETIMHEVQRINQMEAGGRKDEADGVANAIEEMRKALLAKDYHMALDVFGTLTPGQRRSRILQILRLQAAQHVSSEAYSAAMDEMLKVLPDDATAALISFDGLILSKRYDDALKAVDRIDAVEKDPYLDAFRGRVSLAQQKFPETMRLARSALKADPQSYTAVDLLLTAAVNAKDFPAVGEGLDRLEVDAGRPIADLRKAPIFADFVASPEFASWEKRRAQRQGKAATRPAEAPER